jgi:hypothetical protein
MDKESMMKKVGNPKINRGTWAILGMLTWGAALPAGAQNTPDVMGYAGHIEWDGAPLNQPFQARFTVSREDPTDVFTDVWSETWMSDAFPADDGPLSTCPDGSPQPMSNRIEAFGGAFAVELGTFCPFDDSMVEAGRYYLTIEVRKDPGDVDWIRFQNRQRFTSVPFVARVELENIRAGTRQPFDHAAVSETEGHLLRMGLGQSTILSAGEGGDLVETQEFPTADDAQEELHLVADDEVKIWAGAEAGITEPTVTISSATTSLGGDLDVAGDVNATGRVNAKGRVEVEGTLNAYTNDDGDVRRVTVTDSTVQSYFSNGNSTLRLNPAGGDIVIGTPSSVVHVRGEIDIGYEVVTCRGEKTCFCPTGKKPIGGGVNCSARMESSFMRQTADGTAWFWFGQCTKGERIRPMHTWEAPANITVICARVR